MRASAIACAATLAASPALGDPLPVRDQNPLVRGAYLPLPSTPLAADGWRLDTGVQWSNTVNGGVSTRESFLVDAEALELDLALQGRAGAWRFRAGLPVVRRGPGVLDGFIDGWHDVFGLPEGGRPQRPKDAFALFYSRSGRPDVDVERGTALGDVQLEAGRVLATGERGELLAWAGVELPTGRESRLTGNGGVDGALWLSGRRALGDAVTLSGQAGAVLLGGDDPVPLRSSAAFGTLALGWRILPSFEGIVQVDAHSALAEDSRFGFLQSATLLTIGGRIEFASGAAFEAGVTEDIAVNRSPDVSFYLGLRWAR